jgi:ribosomal protein S15P/S13E
MNQKQIEFLSAKIVQISTHIEKVTEDKKDLNAGYNREIRDSKKRVKVYCKAISTDDINKLGEVMGEFELADIEKMGV